MKKISLKWKIAIVGLVPLSICLLLIVYNIYGNYESLKNARQLQSKLDVTYAASALVHETQKERGRTAGFLSNGQNFEALRSQRSLADKEWRLLKKTLSGSAFGQKYKNNLNEVLERYSLIRSKVDSKSISLGFALKEYTQVIATLLHIQNDVANNTGFAKIAAKLRSLRILEESKESGGKLRANMTSILAMNKPITDKKFSTVVSLKAGVDEGIKSNGLILDDKSKSYIKDFQESASWKTVTSTFQLVLKNSSKGGYYQDSVQFFGIITQALGALNDLLDHQKGLMTKEANSVAAQAKSQLWLIVISSSSVFLGLFFFMWRFSSSTSKHILNISNKLLNATQEVSNSSEQMDLVSTKLSEAATEQASSLQETVTSIDEISSMVEKNADSTMSSTQISEKSIQATNTGQDKIKAMICSISEISSSNEQIMDEIDHNNKEISKIVDVISEIGEKTKVINDIVFQTKLLSFNASVEAARAGEHGKGFAVVAEEVGNLASMSGKAALDITEMLDASIKQVTDIVETSKDKIKKLVESGKSKVESGNEIAGDCASSLEEIFQNVSSVNEMIKEISIASTEQSTGVREVTTAMQQLDQVVHQNTSAANESSSTASLLKAQADGLNSAVYELTSLVNGHNNKNNPSSVTEGEGHNLDNVVNFTKQENTRNVPIQNSSLKVSGLDTSIPDESDPRFEDL